MATAPTYPGVYIEEVPNVVRTISGVATSITAFIGRARRGALDKPIHVQSFSEFEREFGGLWRDSMLSYAVQHFFLNGGTDALIVRVFDPTGTLENAHTRFDLASLEESVASAGFEVVVAQRLPGLFPLGYVVAKPLVESQEQAPKKIEEDAP